MDLVVRNARLVTCDPARPGLGVIDHGAVGIEGVTTRDGKLSFARIAWVGADADRPRASRELDAKGALVTPGLVDCHTHAIFAGDRATEFAMRAAGKTYQEIAAAGGGIAATLGPTRAAGNALEGALVDRLHTAMRGGTTTMEVKTGYALTERGELDLLTTIAAASFGHPMKVEATLLAHMIPPERRGDRAGFVAEICDEWIPRAKTATSVDVWCEDAAFTLAEARQILEAATRAKKAVRGHVGQMSDLGGAELLAELGALSADHLEQVGEAGIAALARAGTVAVMLPGACVQLRLPVPPVAKLRAAGVTLAVATDFNPGSSWCETLPIQMWLATTHYEMTVEEAWLGVTRHAAKALGRTDVGALVVGAYADLVVWRADEPAAIPYRYGTSLVDTVIASGQAIS
jgi:imidazolonepropionase